MKIKCTEIKYDEEDDLAFPKQAIVEIDDSYVSLIYDDTLTVDGKDTEFYEALEELLENNAGGASVLSFDYEIVLA